MARIFQHEIDHLDGILFTDRTDRVWKLEGETAQVASVD
jgi:peptide deformylase